MNGGTFNNSGIDILISAPSEKISADENFGLGMLSVDPTQSEVTLQGNISFFKSQ